MNNDLSKLAEIIHLNKQPTTETETLLSEKTIRLIRKRIEQELETGDMPLSGVVTITDTRDPSRVLLTIIIEAGSIVSSSHGGLHHEHCTTEQEQGSEGPGNEAGTEAVLPASGGKG